eukprot:GHVS01028340.1.p1 GENE.GHVS01028340.1~~GHVS01028340.1.p1  ORF type:complete len:698 (+),score=74.69 GHVS01028340.1:50-2143(+)
MTCCFYFSALFVKFMFEIVLLVVLLVKLLVLNISPVLFCYYLLRISRAPPPHINMASGSWAINFVVCCLFLAAVIYPTPCLSKMPIQTKTDDAMCRKVPVTISEICYKEVVESEDYSCGGNLNCVESPVEIHGTCKRHVKKKEAYSCPKTEHKEVCDNVPVTKEETCHRHATRKEPYPCVNLKEVCTDVTLHVPSTCSKHTKKKESYPCEKCKKVPVNSICKKSVEKPFSCSKKEYKEVCEDIVTEIGGHCEAEWGEEAYDCSTVEFKKECSDTKKFDDQKTIPSKRRPMKPSHGLMLKAGGMRGKGSARHQVEAKKMSEMRGRMPGTKGGVTAAASFQHRHENNVVGFGKGRGHTNTSIREMKGSKGVGGGGRLSMLKEPDGLHSHKGEMWDRTRGANKSIDHHHGRSETSKAGVCRSVPVSVSKTCYRRVHKAGGSDHCHKHARKCRKIPVDVGSTCYKRVTVDEKCVTHVVKCEHKKCYREVNHAEHFKCTKPQTTKKCSMEKASGICHKEVTGRESYDCSKTTYEERCHQLPSVSQHTCYRAVEGVEDYACKKTEMQKKCDHKNSNGICHRDRMVKRPYDCSRTEFKVECRSEHKHVEQQKHRVHEKLHRFGTAGSGHEKVGILHHGAGAMKVHLAASAMKVHKGVASMKVHRGAGATKLHHGHGLRSHDKLYLNKVRTSDGGNVDEISKHSW